MINADFSSFFSHSWLGAGRAATSEDFPHRTRRGLDRNCPLSWWVVNHSASIWILVIGKRKKLWMQSNCNLFLLHIYWTSERVWKQMLLPFFIVPIFSLDSVRLFATAVRELDSLDAIEATKINCKQPTPWEHGSRIINYMKLVSLSMTIWAEWRIKLLQQTRVKSTEELGKLW